MDKSDNVILLLVSVKACESPVHRGVPVATGPRGPTAVPPPGCADEAAFLAEDVSSDLTQESPGACYSQRWSLLGDLRDSYWGCCRPRGRSSPGGFSAVRCAGSGPGRICDGSAGRVGIFGVGAASITFEVGEGLGGVLLGSPIWVVNGYGVIGLFRSGSVVAFET